MPLNKDKTESQVISRVVELFLIVASIVATAVFLAYLGICVYSSIMLVRAVPVSPEDLRSSSWLSATTYQYFGHYIPLLVGCVIIVLGCISIVLRQSLFPIFIHIPLGICLLVFNDQEAVFRSAALQGMAKIGCYSYEARECREMHGLDTTGAPSMYQAAMLDNEQSRYAPWYLEVRNKVPAPVVLDLPGVSFLLSPFDLQKAEELNQLLSTQRSELERKKREIGERPSLM